ncbi:MAG: cache domain-containing protein [Methyloceanibacter sp.]|uniref:cache domain-containing protein n=1 Tax=Methyloceanibacter sp. TaxID=1965321 RepID=UPI003C60CE3F
MARRLTTIIILSIFGIAVGIVTAASVDRFRSNEALSIAFDRLRLFHNLRQAALEDYLRSMASDVRAASESPRVVEAMEKLDFAWKAYGPDARKVLPRLYIDENTARPDERAPLLETDDGSDYIQYHHAFHGWAQRFLDHFGYYDAFLINPRGDIIYSVAKERDFATSVKTGPYRKSPLADVFRNAMENPSAAVDFSDFAFYAPSGGDPAAFAAHAITRGGKVLGVFAVQIPAEPINELMQFTAGMGATGETYLVGQDGRMRSQSRFIETPTLLEVKVDNASVQDGMAGQSGARIVKDYRGIAVLSVYAPVNFGGQPWILLAEIDREEAITMKRPWTAAAVGILAGLLAMGFASLIWHLVRGPTEASMA